MRCALRGAALRLFRTVFVAFAVIIVALLAATS